MISLNEEYQRKNEKENFNNNQDRFFTYAKKKKMFFLLNVLYIEYIIPFIYYTFHDYLKKISIKINMITYEYNSRMKLDTEQMMKLKLILIYIIIGNGKIYH